MADLTTTPSGWRMLAEGYGFVEGPVARGNLVDFVSVNRGVVYRAALDGTGATKLRELGGGPNGAAADASGLWVVNNGGRVMDGKSEITTDPGIQRIGLDGSVSAWLRSDLHAPNDCAFGPDGRLWFTDPYGRLLPPVDGPQGRVWAFNPSDGEFELIAEGLPHPNGLAFSADGSELYVTDTKDCSVVAFDVDGAGVRRGREVSVLPHGQPDGMAFDLEGRLWIAATTSEGICVLETDGSWSFIDLGDSFPTNLCFAGDELTTLVVTAARGGRVIARDAVAPGVPLFGAP
ncbi:SMP-30/gluconolactonase/LRE family protein [Microcella sp.]|uniref:SMP-30/gluconolactonase/LRE family protein n=1 Tax=Microcella sp. TaxID=1913979 RepID=UPI00256B7F05|nr:SMP-30/gluconolactonase/LRE family protein [Microcella sp.]MBX9472367.1 SMP-30/gluconolactonase/LRE family protein [Microcella sp.]